MKKMAFASEHLVIGLGEVGSAIAKILECDGIDVNNHAPQKSYRFLHICIPYSENFLKIVEDYQYQYSPDYTVIHSTVPMRTTRMILGAVHSPVFGVHPNLEKGIRTFTKYFGGKNARICAEPFVEKGIKCEYTIFPESTEVLKLYDTLQFGINILIEKEIHDVCKENKLDFDLVYTRANKNYNEGYEKLGYPEYKKYILKHIEGPIGGHCILSNAELLNTSIARFLCKSTKS